MPQITSSWRLLNWSSTSRACPIKINIVSLMTMDVGLAIEEKSCGVWRSRTHGCENGAWKWNSNCFFKVDAYNKTTDTSAKESCWAPSKIYQRGHKDFSFIEINSLSLHVTLNWTNRLRMIELFLCIPRCIFLPNKLRIVFLLCLWIANIIGKLNVLTLSHSALKIKIKL